MPFVTKRMAFKIYHNTAVGNSFSLSFIFNNGYVHKHSKSLNLLAINKVFYYLFNDESIISFKIFKSISSNLFM